jgi:hypothetical protein
VNGGSISIGYLYSLLDWVPDTHQSWSLSGRVKRIPSERTAVEMGIEQVQELSQNRAGMTAGLEIVAADGKYGNAQFLCPLLGQHCGIVVHLRSDRILYWAPESPQKRKRGRPRIHGERFAFKKPDTWDIPDETITFEVGPHLNSNTKKLGSAGVG